MWKVRKRLSDGAIAAEELEQAWGSRFKGGAACHSKPVHALLIIDVQNDFIDGSLGLKHCPGRQDGAAVVPVINKLRSSVRFDAVAVSLDWHPHAHCSFHEVVTAGQSPAPLHPSQARAPFGSSVTAMRATPCVSAGPARSADAGPVLQGNADRTGRVPDGANALAAPLCPGHVGLGVPR
jgi:hypothetical protein